MAVASPYTTDRGNSPVCMLEMFSSWERVKKGVTSRTIKRLPVLAIITRPFARLQYVPIQRGCALVTGGTKANLSGHTPGLEHVFSDDYVNCDEYN